MRSSRAFLSPQPSAIEVPSHTQALQDSSDERAENGKELSDTLQFLAGKWDCYPSDAQPRPTAPMAQTVCKNKGRCIVAKTSSTLGQTPGLFRSEMGYDSERKCFVDLHVNHTDDIGFGTAPGWDGNDLTFRGTRVTGSAPDDRVTYEKRYTKITDYRFEVAARIQTADGGWRIENAGLADKVVESNDVCPSRAWGEPLAAAEAGVGLKPVWWIDIEADLPRLRNQPLHIRTARTQMGQALETLQRKSSPSALTHGPLAHDLVPLIDGQDAKGQSLAKQSETLAEIVAPCLQPGFAQDSGAYAFAGIMINRDRPPHLAEGMPEAGPWHAHFLNAEPEMFPRTLLHGKREAFGDRLVPPMNTSVMLGVGRGPGQYFHIHGANLFVQLWGEKKWSIFLPEDMKPYLDATRPYVRRQPAPFLPPYTEHMERMLWDDKAFPNMPRPMEIITKPGDILYLPDFTWHATWNLTPYTVGYTAVVDL